MSNSTCHDSSLLIEADELANCTGAIFGRLDNSTIINNNFNNITFTPNMLSPIDRENETVEVGAFVGHMMFTHVIDMFLDVDMNCPKCLPNHTGFYAGLIFHDPYASYYNVTMFQKVLMNVDFKGEGNFVVGRFGHSEVGAEFEEVNVFMNCDSKLNILTTELCAEESVLRSNQLIESEKLDGNWTWLANANT